MTDPDVPTFRISSPHMAADISALGAELRRLQDEGGRDLLWNGDPAFWTGRAPVLFPIVGRLKGDQLKVAGVPYPMRQHGLARTSTFELVAHEAMSCRLRLKSSAKTKESYPFDFSFDLTYRVNGATLEIEAEARNTGSGPMPVACGYHPAFRWPLPYGEARAAHGIVFEHDEPGAISPLAGGLLSSSGAPSPVRGRTLGLSDALFKNDALVFLRPASRSVRYGASAPRALRIDFAGMPQLGIWSKPGAGFVCVEPWHGYASPEDFDGDLFAKPGMIAIAPGEAHVFAMQVVIEGSQEQP